MPGTRGIERTGTVLEIRVKVMKRHVKSLVCGAYTRRRQIIHKQTRECKFRDNFDSGNSQR